MKELKRQLFLIQPSANSEANVSKLIFYLENKNHQIREQLLEHGTLLFRGFNLSSAEDFSSCVKACHLGDFFSYSGGAAPRKKITEGVYNSTDVPSNDWVPPHNEMSYLPNHPKHVYFYCHHPAKCRGSTPIVDGRLIYQSIEPFLREKMENYGLIYKRFMYDNSKLMKFLTRLNPIFLTWQKSYGTSDPQQVEKKLHQQHVEFEWLPQGGLRTQIKLPAFRSHPITQEKVWFNQSNLLNNYKNICFNAFGPHFSWLFRYLLLMTKNLPQTTTFGNGDEITKLQINHLIKVITKHLIIMPWEKGDFMVIDNYLNLHAREPYAGNRLIMASLTR